MRIRQINKEERLVLFHKEAGPVIVLKPKF